MPKQYKVRSYVKKKKSEEPKGPVYKMKPDDKRKWDRKRWLEAHPEDIPLDEENQMWRRQGYDNDGIRQLFAAICLRVCIDYKNATLNRNVDGKTPEETIEDCRKFFKEDIFQFFVNRIPVEEIERTIRATPKDAIHSIWRNHENNQATQAI